MATYSDLIQKVQRILMPRSVEVIQLTASYTAGAGTVTLDTTSPIFSAVRPGSVLAIDQEVMYVYGAPNPSTGVTAVIYGWQGSTNANHANSATCLVSPQYTPFDIAQAVNDEILGLSSPDVGLGQVDTVDITYNPAFVGYDLGSTFDGLRSRVLEVSYKIAPPYRTYPLIRRGEYRVIRDQSDSSVFPSGNGIILYKGAWPGLPVHVQFIAPFAPLVNQSDDALTVGGIPTSSQDIVWMGAVVRLVPQREIPRNDLGWQPDPRKAPEVPPGAINASIAQIEAQYFRRRNEEASYLKRAYPQAEFV